MKVWQAVGAARQWVEREGVRLPGFCGAYLAGSCVEKAPESELPPSSDLDVMAVLNGPVPEKPGKFLYQGVLLEVSVIGRDAFNSLEHVLSTHYLAYALHVQSILSDPEGWLSPLQKEAALHYAEPRWVKARFSAIAASIRRDLADPMEGAPFYLKLNSLNFSAGKLTHILLAAALQNCTVRLRYPAVRQALAAYGMDRVMELLKPCQCARQPSQAQLLSALNDLSETFGLACRAQKSRFFFSSDISLEARPIAIDGSRELILGPHPSDAIFWMTATFCRCHQILEADAPSLHRERLPALLRFAQSLGAGNEREIAARRDAVSKLVPKVEKAALELISRRA